MSEEDFKEGYDEGYEVGYDDGLESLRDTIDELKAEVSNLRSVINGSKSNLEEVLYDLREA